MLLAAAQPQQSPESRAALEDALRRLGQSLASGSGAADATDRAFRAMLSRDIQRWLSRPATAAAIGGAPPDLPPGPPIGGAAFMDDCEWGHGRN